MKIVFDTAMTTLVKNKTLITQKIKVITVIERLKEFWSRVTMKLKFRSRIN
jgi:hypothetical protein